MDEELDARLRAIEDHLDRINGLLDEFVPQLRAYLDPDAGGPRGWYMKRQLAKGVPG